MSSTSTSITSPRRACVPHPTPDPSVFDLNDIQGDVFPSFPKKCEWFIFFDIQDPVAFKKALCDFIPKITTAARVMNNLKAVNLAQQPTTPAHEYQSQAPFHYGRKERKLVPLKQYQIALTKAGFDVLGVTGKLQDTDFDAGQLADAFNLGDRPGPGSTAAKFVPDWEPVWRENVLHGVILIATESAPTCRHATAEALEIFGSTIKVVNTIEGAVRAPEPGHEHFGFLDGVSQPAMNGLVVPHTGQLQCDPGVILMGQKGDPKTRPSWAKNGTLMVFRKLQQDVPKFDAFLKANPTKLPGLSDPEAQALTGAKLVGRWKSGTPIDLAPEKDDPAIAQDVNRINAFNYQNPTPGEARCPFAAHIRKTSPRFTTVTGLNNALPGALILRAGIPYGPEVTPMEAAAGQSTEDRGLAFVCYQSVLGNGFGTLQKVWANKVNFPPPETTDPGRFMPGFDPVIGNAIGANRDRTVSGTDPTVESKTLDMPADFVIAKGGEYFFVPSMTALGMLSRGETLGET
ncbi:hypothetical protein FRB93_012584 [Tulasnella sp. JGI-2019a]|nr:hypothetical protein FRB93_012584 [Tulasnella sp. JGI-2019a]